MAIVKASGRVTRLDGDASLEMISADESDDDEEEEVSNCSASSSSSDTESDPSDADSGMESDEFDLSELGEARTEFCQVGNQSFSVPVELYDLPDSSSVLSLEIWNQCLTEEERFGLSKFLPDMDQETLARTLSELFAGKNFHFSSPVNNLFRRLKGGMLDPRVVLYRRGLSFFQKREHYHLLRKYQNSMVGGLVKIRDAWHNCSGYGIEERLRLLNIFRSQKSLVDERNGDVGSDTDPEENSEECLSDKRFKIDCRALKPMRYGKDNAKGILKVTPPKVSAKREYMGVSDWYLLPGKHGIEKKGKASKGLLGFSQQDQRFDLGSSQEAWRQMRGGIDGDEEDDYDDDGFVERLDTRASLLKSGKKEVLKQNTRRQMRGGNDGDEEDDYDDDRFVERLDTRASLLKSGKKELLKQNTRSMEHRFGNVDTKARVALPQYSTESRIADQGVTIAANNPHALETMSSAKYPAKDWMHPVKGRVLHQGQRVTQADWSVGEHPYLCGKPNEVISSGRQFKAEEGSVKSKKWKSEDDYKRSYKTSPVQISDSYGKTVQGKFKGKSAYNGGVGMEHSRSCTMLTQSDETESDSSENLEEDGEISPYPNGLGYPTAAIEGCQPGGVRTLYDFKKSAKITTVDKNVQSRIHPQEVEPYSSKGKLKSKTADLNYMMEDIVLVKKSQVPHPSRKLQQPWQKSHIADKKRKGAVDLDHISEPNYIRDYGSGRLGENAEYLDGSPQYLDGQMQTNNKSGNRYQASDALNGRSNMPLLVCNPVTKKRKGNADIMNKDETEESVYQESSLMQLIDEPNFTKKKGKRKSDALIVPSAVIPDTMIPEKETAVIEPEPPMPQKKPFTLITPTKHTGFSFSIIHLLSAIRKAMITPVMEDAAGMGNHIDKGELKPKGEDNEALQAVYGTDLPKSHESIDVIAPESAGQNNLPSLTVQEIVDRVRTNPGDPCILETQEPLQDLVRGVLKIFSSKTAPLGAKAWKAIISYEKSNKSWSWVGPVSSGSSDNDNVEEETSPEAWGLPHKTLVKLVDSFAIWLKNGQETLKQIGSLPPPPAEMLLQLDEKERFRDLRAQKSLNTILPSSEEVRDYFRKEELLRYSIPDRAFSYTAADGKKSIVAPLRRGGGKPTSKARDHFMLKPDRPPHVTILCLVRDAAARLPGSIGTRADVCTLIRDSQYIVEDVSDEKVTQVVSGALDRLHYERDPCVQFDGDRKLWVYLHRDREEEDFEDDGTSSTKKWKRPKKDAADQPETGAGNDANYPMTGDPPGGGSGICELKPDLNIDTSSVQEVTENVPVYNDLRSNMENIQSYIDPSSGGGGQVNAMSWEPLELNPLCENKMLCQDNSTNENFDEEAFSRKRPAGLLSASLL